jgi:hypothetical protein
VEELLVTAVAAESEELADDDEAEFNRLFTVPADRSL